MYEYNGVIFNILYIKFEGWLNPGSVNRRQGLWGGFGLPRPG